MNSSFSLSVVFADPKSSGIITARGFVQNPQPPFTPSPDRKISVGKEVGNGFIRIMRRHPIWKSPFVGTTALATGEIGDDLAMHLYTSEQVRSVVGVGVYYGEGVEAAAGFIASCLPNCDEGELSILEENVMKLAPPSELLRSGLSSGDIASMILGDLGERVRTTEPVKFHCSCSTDASLGSFVELDPASSTERKSSSDVMKCEWCGALRVHQGQFSQPVR